MNHERWMREALAEARRALETGDVPIGAVIVKDQEIIGRGHNCKEAWQDPTAHAEMIALREAARTLGSWRLAGTVLYVTLEPCPMCAGALVQARVDAVVFAARDPKAGAVGSVYDLVRSPWLNHRLHVTSGILEQEARALLQRFFQQKRENGS